MHWALPQEETSEPGRFLQLVRLAVLFITMLVGFFALFQLASLAMNLGDAGAIRLGSLSFLGNFLFQTGDIVRIITPVLGGLAAGGALSGFMGLLGQRITKRWLLHM